MSTEVYEVVAQAMRYWFLFLMALIVWRSYRWYRRDRRQRKKRLRLLPDAGYVGELVVTDGGGVLREGAALPVPREGTLGFLRTNDVVAPVDGVAGKHLWFTYDFQDGLMIEPYRGKPVTVDGQPFVSRRQPLYMAHGSRLKVGAAAFRLRLFAGFETAAGSRARSRVLAGDEPDADGAQGGAMTPEQYAAYQQWMTRAMAGQVAGQPGFPGTASQPPLSPQGAPMTPQQYAAYQQQLWAWQQAAYQQWLWQRQSAQGGAYGADTAGAYDEDDVLDENALYGTDEAFDENDGIESNDLGAYGAPVSSASGVFISPKQYAAMPQSGAMNSADNAADDTVEAAASVGAAEAYNAHAYPQPDHAREGDFYAPTDDESDGNSDSNEFDEPDGYDAFDPAALDDDLTDAAQPPKSAYIGHDEAEAAKKKVWDRYLGGGRRR